MPEVKTAAAVRKTAKKPSILKLIKIQRTSVHDGPGIRTTLFFQGCGLRCPWCQNPEGLPFESERAADYSVDDLVRIINKDKNYYFSSGGGVTLSGGEPFLQPAEALISLLKELKKENINVAAETALNAPWENIEKALPFIDLFYVDLKGASGEKHKELTGSDGALVYENLKKLVEAGANIAFRMILVPGLNDSEENIAYVASALASAGKSEIEIMKYHSMYESKADAMKIEYKKLGITDRRADEAVEEGIKAFQKFGIAAFCET
jgi:Pyruvate-formate lyase-activating enzyme